MRDKKITSLRFETNCSDLVDNYKPDGSAIFREVFQRLQEDFQDVSLSYIFWSRNDQADALANDTRTRDYIFSHIDQIWIFGNTSRRIGSYVLHLI